MKKQSLILFLSASLLLVGCGSSSNGIVPSGAKEVDISSASKGLSTAATALSEGDSFGLSVDKASMSLTADVTNGGGYCRNSSCSYFMNQYVVSLEAKDMSLAINAKGLQSKNVNDVAASAIGSGSITGKFSSPSSVKSGMNAEVSFDYSDMKGAGYIKDGVAYADLSNQNFLNFIGLAYSMVASGSGSLSIAAGKYTSGTAILSSDNLPLLSTNIKSSIVNAISSIAPTITSYSDFIKSYSYDNGNYALNFSLTKDNLAAFINKASSSSSSSAAASSSNNANSIMSAYASFFNITTFEMCLVYGTKGLVSYEEKVDVSVDTTLGEMSDKLVSISAISSEDAVPSQYRDVKEKIAFKTNSKVNFLADDDVKVTYPSDLASYTPFASK